MHLHRQEASELGSGSLIAHCLSLTTSPSSAASLCPHWVMEAAALCQKVGGFPACVLVDPGFPRVRDRTHSASQGARASWTEDGAPTY